MEIHPPQGRSPRPPHHPVNFLLDSVRVCAFKHIGIFFSDNAYSEAVQDFQEGMKLSCIEVRRKAIKQGILDMAYREGMDIVL